MKCTKIIQSALAATIALVANAADGDLERITTKEKRVFEGYYNSETEKMRLTIGKGFMEIGLKNEDIAEREVLKHTETEQERKKKADDERYQQLMKERQEERARKEEELKEQIRVKQEEREAAAIEIAHQKTVADRIKYWKEHDVELTGEFKLVADIDAAANAILAEREADKRAEEKRKVDADNAIRQMRIDAAREAFEAELDAARKKKEMEQALVKIESENEAWVRRFGLEMYYIPNVVQTMKLPCVPEKLLGDWYAWRGNSYGVDETMPFFTTTITSRMISGCPFQDTCEITDVESQLVKSNSIFYLLEVSTAKGKRYVIATFNRDDNHAVISAPMEKRPEGIVPLSPHIIKKR